MKSAQKVLKNDIADPLEISLAAMPSPDGRFQRAQPD